MVRVTETTAHANSVGFPNRMRQEVDSLNDAVATLPRRRPVTCRRFCQVATLTSNLSL